MNTVYRAQTEIAYLISEDIRLNVSDGKGSEVKPIRKVIWSTALYDNFYIHDVTAYSEDNANVTLAAVYHPDEELPTQSWVPRPPNGWDDTVRDLAMQRPDGAVAS